MQNESMTDPLALGDETVTSRLLLGTARYPSPEVLRRSIRAAGAEIVTVSLRRQAPGERAGEGFWELLRSLGVRVLPNTAGCRSAREAVTTARMAREIFDTPWIKLEVIGDEYTLQPDPFGLVEAARELVGDGFEVFPYTTDDLVLADRLVDCGCKILMPWGSPIGSGQGLRNPRALETLRARFPGATLIVDAGIGRPSDAVQALEMGYDAVLVNTAVAEAAEPERMAAAFAHAVRAGRLAHHARPIPVRDTAQASTPLTDTPFWHQH